MKKVRLEPICGYCGFQRDTESRLLNVGKKGIALFASDVVAHEMMEAKRNDKAYWLKVCPACGSVADIIVWGEK